MWVYCLLQSVPPQANSGQQNTREIAVPLGETQDRHSAAEWIRLLFAMAVSKMELFRRDQSDVARREKADRLVQRLRRVARDFEEHTN